MTSPWIQPTPGPFPDWPLATPPLPLPDPPSSPDIPPAGWPDPDYAPYDANWPVPNTLFQLLHHGSNFNPDMQIDTSRTSSTGPDDIDWELEGGGGRFLTAPSAMTAAPTLSDIQNWSPQDLTSHSEHWQDLAQRRVEVVGKIRNDAEGLPWTGQGHQAMLADVNKHHSVATSEADVFTAAARTATDAAGQLADKQQQILKTVQQAENQGFLVTPTWQVVDTATDPMEQMLRQPVAQTIASDLAQQVATFTALDTQAGADLSAHAGTLAGVTGLPEGKVQCFGPDEQHTNCVEQHPDGSTTTFPGIPAMQGQWPDASAKSPNAGSGVRLVGNDQGPVYYDKWGRPWSTPDQAWCSNQGTPWDQCWAYGTAGAKVGEGRVSLADYHTFKADGPTPTTTPAPPSPPAGGSIPWKSGFDPGPPPLTTTGPTTSGVPTAKGFTLEHPSSVIQPEPKPVDPRDHDCSVREIFDQVGTKVIGGTGGVAAGIAGITAGAAAAAPTGGLSTLPMLGGITSLAVGSAAVVDGLDDLSHCTNLNPGQ